MQSKTLTIVLSLLVLVLFDLQIHRVSCYSLLADSIYTVEKTVFNMSCGTSADCNHGEYVCNNKRCTSCVTSDQCNNGAISLCQSAIITVNETIANYTPALQELKVKRCVNKKLLPIQWQDIVITAVCFVGGSFAASTGIGGGGIYVPIMLLVGGYSAQTAVPLSTVMIFGCSIANFLMLAPQRHPTAQNRPLINYSATLILQPIILCGSSLGVLLNATIPNWFLVILLAALVSFTTYKTFKKGLDLRRKENQKSNEELDLQEMSDAADQEFTDVALQEFSEAADQEFSVDDVDINEEKLKQEANITSDENETQKEQTDEMGSSLTRKSNLLSLMSSSIIDMESQRFPIVLLFFMGAAWIVVFIISLLSGSKRAPSIIGIQQCSFSYWILIICQFPILFGYSMLIGWVYHMIYRRKLAIGYKFEEGDIKWTARNAILLPSLFLSAGLVAGLLGIGGGMVTGPLLMALGSPPQVSVATSSFMIFFTSSSTVAQYALIGSIPLDYGLWYISFGILSGMLGQFLIGLLLKRFNKASWVVFCVCFTIAISCMFMVGVGIYRTIVDIKMGNRLGFKPMC